MHEPKLSRAVPRSHSVWLIPNRESLAWCSNLVDEMAARYSVASFLPHMTVWSDIRAPLEEIRQVISDIAGTRRHVDLEVTGLDHSPARFFAVTLCLVETEELKWLRRLLKARLGLEGYPTRPPHVSLIYHELEEADRLTIKKEFENREVPRHLTFDTVAVVFPRHGNWDDLDSWVVEKEPLITQASLADGNPEQVFEGMLKLHARLSAAAKQVSVSSVELDGASWSTYAFDVGVDPLRDLEPLDEKYGCIFCQWSTVSHATSCSIPGLMCHVRLTVDHLLGSKLLVFSPSRNPYPDLEAVRGVYHLISKAAKQDIELLGVCNLPGSGASAPEHFHWQVVSRHSIPYETPIDIVLSNLPMGRAEVSADVVVGGVHINKIQNPVPGLRFVFPDTWSPEACAQWVHRLIFEGAMHHQHGALSVNLYLWWQDGHMGIALWRNAPREAPTNNPNWRWGWMEMTGCIPVRAGERRDFYENAGWLPVARKCGISSEQAERLFEVLSS